MNTKEQAPACAGRNGAHTAIYYEEQAELAERYAASRRASDIRGYVEAMMDAKLFRAEAIALATQVQS